MSNLLFADTWAEPWIDALWTASWQGAIVLATAWGIARWCTFLSPRIICWVWRLACIKLLVILFWTQPVTLPLLPGNEFVVAVSQTTLPQATGARPTATQSVPERTDPTPIQGRLAASELLVLLWLTGIAFCVVATVRQWREVRRLCRATVPIQSAALERLCREQAGLLNVGRLPELRLSMQSDGPLLAGVWRPTIVLPAESLTVFGEAEQRLMVAHELAHFKRRDLAWNWLPTVVGWLFFFHPLVWQLSRGWSESQEAACDELVIQNHAARPSEYGRLLVKTSAYWPPSARAELCTAGVLGAYRNLERRILAMTRVQPFSRGRLACAACVALLIAVPGTIPWRLVAQEVRQQAAEPAVDNNLEEVRKAWSQTMDQMKQLGLGMHTYHIEHKSFPPPALVDGDGKPLLSWRVALLPYLEDDYKELYGEFHLDEPWDSEHNKPLVAKMPAIYRCPRSKKADSGMTVYQVPRGPSTVFAGPDGISIRKIPDGTSNTICVVEVDENDAVPWTKPEEWPFDPANPAKGLGGHFPERFICLVCDGSAHAIPTTTKKETLSALFTRNGGEVVEFPQ